MGKIDYFDLDFHLVPSWEFPTPLQSKGGISRGRRPRIKVAKPPLKEAKPTHCPEGAVAEGHYDSSPSPDRGDILLVHR